MIKNLFIGFMVFCPRMSEDNLNQKRKLAITRNSKFWSIQMSFGGIKINELMIKKWLMKTWKQHIFRPIGRWKIFGVLMTFAACYSCYPEILGLLNTAFFLISRNIGGAIPPPAPPVLPAWFQIGIPMRNSTTQQTIVDSDGADKFCS